MGKGINYFLADWAFYDAQSTRASGGSLTSLSAKRAS
jgi:hypothetical protein